jgi:predicted CoA-substrate-specific enzyme activase
MSNVTVFAGVDVGSLGTKTVIFADGEIAGSSVLRTGIHAAENGLEGIEKALDNASLKREDIKYIVGTGYGRVSAPYADKTITEITCHAKGANYLHPGTRTVIDMGGQDCKAIRVDEYGNVIDFAMNDKCAAGTGRFLEVMANVFKVDISELGELALKATQILPVSSTCTVFAESETISLLARGEKPENIIIGVHHAIANRISGMFARVGIESDVFFSGGVAKNIGMIKAIEEVMNVKLARQDTDPQLVGAIGAAVFAQELYQKSLVKSRKTA